MQFKKKFLALCIFLFFCSSFVYSNDVFGKYTYTRDTVLSIMKLSLLENGIKPDSIEFNEDFEDIKVMISKIGEESFIKNIKDKSPFSSIELTSNYLILHLAEDDFKIPIEVIKNEIYSKAVNSSDKIIGFLESNKLYFNFYVAYEKPKNKIVKENLKPFYLIPFEKVV